jgi:hypothetical protein
LIKYLGFAFLIWLFGILVFIPTSEYIHSLSGFVGVILLIPIGILYLRVVWDMKIISQILGSSLANKHGKIQYKKSYIHMFYAFWIIVTIIFFTSILFYINKVIGGLFLFIGLSCIIFLIFINLKYIIAIFLRYFS